MHPPLLSPMDVLKLAKDKNKKRNKQVMHKESIEKKNESTTLSHNQLIMLAHVTDNKVHVDKRNRCTIID